MMRLLKTPSFWIAFQIVFLFGLSWKVGWLTPVHTIDSESYVVMSEGDIFTAANLLKVRTLGYPLFLKTVRTLTGSLDAVPILQLVFYLGCVLFLSSSLAFLRVGPWYWGAFASILFVPLYAEGSPLFRCILTDLPSYSFLLLTLGVLFRTVRKKPSPLSLAGIAVFSFCAYQIRPVYLFTLGFIPFLGLLLLAIQEEPTKYLERRFRYVFTLALAVALPFLGYATIRRLITGQFGLVSFGGYNIVGVAAQLMDEEVAASLPSALQPLASAILARRTDPAVLKSYDKTEYLSPIMGKYNVNRQRIHENVNYVGWVVTAPLAGKFFEGDVIQANAAFAALSKEIIRLRPVAYGVWVAKAFFYSVATAMTTLPFLLATAGVISFYLCGLLMTLTTWASAPGSVITREDVRLTNTLLVISASLFVLKTLTIVVNVPPYDRYIVTAAGLLPLLPCVLSLLSLKILRARRKVQKLSAAMPPAAASPIQPQYS